jgi:prophage regulatory protein
MSTVLNPIYIQLDELPSLIKLATTTVQRLVREGKFPAPRELSDRRVGWLLREVEQRAEDRPVSNIPPPANTGRRRRPTEQLSAPQASDQGE